MAWNVLWAKKPVIYFKGDLCNPLISTADLLAGTIDAMLTNQPFSKDAIDNLLTNQLHLRGETSIIGSQDLRWIAPLSRMMINTYRFMKHPVYYLITERRPGALEYKEAVHQFEFSPIFDDIVSLACQENGAIKFYDKSQDYLNISAEDKVIYFEDSGKEIAMSLEKQKYITKSYYYGHEEIK